MIVIHYICKKNHKNIFIKYKNICYKKRYKNNRYKTIVSRTRKQENYIYIMNHITYNVVTVFAKHRGISISHPLFKDK